MASSLVIPVAVQNVELQCTVSDQTKLRRKKKVCLNETNVLWSAKLGICNEVLLGKIHFTEEIKYW